MTVHSREQASLVDEAQDWDRALQSGGPAERTAFAAWIRRSPEHLQAYLQHHSLKMEVRDLDADKEFDLDELLAQVSNNVVPLTSTHPPRHPVAGKTRRSRTHRYRYAALVAGALLIAGVIGWHTKNTSTSFDYKTATGEQRRIALLDGSIVELNTQSHIRVAYRAGTREVDLISGEAVFNVQHNIHRPFRVHVRTTTIEDVGTQFAVYIRPDTTTTVSVLDGRIRLSVGPSKSASRSFKSEPPTKTGNAIDPLQLATPTQVAAGEEVRIDANGRLVNRAPLNVAEAASWRQHRVLFDNASLEQVAAEFNRYNARKLQIGDDAVTADKRYTATWDPYDPESFIEYLKSDPTLRVQTDEARTVIRAR